LGLGFGVQILPNQPTNPTIQNEMDLLLKKEVEEKPTQRFKMKWICF